MGGCHVQPEQMFNLIFGFDSILNEEDTCALAGGSTYAFSDEVPADKVWVVHLFSVRPMTRAATNFYVGVFIDPDYIFLASSTTGIAQFYPFSFPYTFHLAEGQVLFASVGGGQNGDDVRLYYSGYQMTVTQ